MNTHTIIKQRFDSVEDLLAWQESTPQIPKSQNQSHVGSDSFCGDASFDDAAKLAVFGWEEGAKRIEAERHAMVDKISSRIVRHDLFYDVEGQGIDVARYVEGEPECWQHFVPVETKSQSGRIVRILVNCAYSAHVKPEVITARGALICALIDAMELAGYSTEVSMLLAASNGNKLTDFRCVVKRSDQPLHLGRLAFALAHAAMLRRLFFTVEERTPQCNEYVCDGTYGHVQELPEELQDTDIYFPGMRHNEAFDLAGLEKLLREQGIEVLDSGTAR